MSHIKGRVFLVVSVAFCAFWSTSSQAELVKVSSRVFQEETVIAPDGTRAVRHVPAANLHAGSELVYEVTYSNVGNKPTAQVIITNPLPSDLAYRSVPGRSTGAAFDVSVDNGETYGPLASLTVQEPGGAKRPARESDITHVRWTINEPVAPGQEGKVSLRAVVR